MLSMCLTITKTQRFFLLFSSYNNTNDFAFDDDVPVGIHTRTRHIRYVEFSDEIYFVILMIRCVIIVFIVATTL